MEPQDPQENQDQTVLPELLVWKEVQDHKETKEAKLSMDHLELQEQQEHQ